MTNNDKKNSTDKKEKMSKMFWIDLEMTGLDEKTCRIIEVAVIVTDLHLNELETYHRVVQQPHAALDAMDEWCTKTHGATGLTAKVLQGPPVSFPEAQVESELLELIERHFPADERIVLCGNSVGNDQRFLLAYMQKLAKRLHYRIIDVSSFKQVFRSRFGVEFPKNDDRHRALDDVKASIAELAFYLKYIQVPG